MSGHSHWATIRRSMAANDAKRGRVWSKVARRIIMAAKTGGGKKIYGIHISVPVNYNKAMNANNFAL